ncbi:MAG: hypothetical protein KTR21_10285 [Rhodobacteraceae bacterium]|nr:hypothetical protein [Paracoccaceae bacterium]
MSETPAAPLKKGYAADGVLIKVLLAELFAAYTPPSTSSDAPSPTGVS